MSQTGSSKYGKKRFYREQAKTHKDTPKSRTYNIMREPVSASKVRRSLLFHNVLTTALRERIQNSKKLHEKKIVTKIITGDMFRKYIQVKWLVAHRRYRRTEKTAVYGRPSVKLFRYKTTRLINFIFGMEVQDDEMVPICSFGADGRFYLATRWR